MSTPQGPDRYGADRDPDHDGPPTWGAPPPGGWGRPDDGPPTGAWDPAEDDRAYGDPGYGDPGYDDAGYVGRRRADDRDGDRGAGAPWGDQAGGYGGDPGYGSGGYGPAYDDRPTPERDTAYVPAAGGPDDPWSDGGPTAAWGAERPQDFAPGDEPWAPRDEVREPWRGPGGLGAGALAGIGVGVVVLIALVVALFVTPGWLVTRTLDKTALQNGVTQILTQSYGLQVGAVECPDDVVVEAGTGFSCQALIDGEPVQVPGKVTTDEGDYQVSRV